MFFSMLDKTCSSESVCASTAVKLKPVIRSQKPFFIVLMFYRGFYHIHLAEPVQLIFFHHFKNNGGDEQNENR